MYCTRKVTEDLTWVGADDRRLACFEGVYGVPDGVLKTSPTLWAEGSSIILSFPTWSRITRQR